MPNETYELTDFRVEDIWDAEPMDESDEDFAAILAEIEAAEPAE